MTSPSYETDSFTPPVVTFTTIRKAVSPFGTWVEVPVYGEVWKPNPEIVGKNWTPYTKGRWIYTSWGWTWLSDFKEWGWAAFHYGRFAHTPTAGWVMINDILWAPAQALWKESENMIGWAPLPPGYSVMEAVRFGASVHVPRQGWSFVPKEQLTSTDLSRHFLSDYNKKLIFRYACSINQWQERGEIIHYTGPDPQNLLSEHEQQFPYFTFQAAQERFATRFLPNPSMLPPQNTRPIVYSEVRVDIGDRIAVVGPDSPKKLPKRKKRRIYTASDSGESEKQVEKTRNIAQPQRPTQPTRPTTSSTRPTTRTRPSPRGNQ